MKKYAALLLLLCFAHSVSATHLLGGEILTKSTTALSYEITVVLYLDILTGTPEADAQSTVTLCLGNGQQRVVNRTMSNALAGVDGVNRSEYTTQYTYAAPGTYALSVHLMPLGNTVVNLPSAQQEAMVLQTSLTTTQPNTSAPAPTPTFRTGLRQPFILSLPSNDPDGDSLAHRLVRMLHSTATCAPATPSAGYLFPNQVTTEGIFRLDYPTKTLVWRAPTQVGVYVYAYVTEEWRRGVKVAESWRTNLLSVSDKGAVTEPVPPYEPVRLFAEGIVTGVPSSEFLPAALSMKVYPVPSYDLLTVQVECRPPAAVTIEVLDLQGRVLQSTEFDVPASHHFQQVNLRTLASGVYILRAKNAHATSTRKIIR